MGARKDQPEMFEAFKRVEEAKRNQANLAGAGGAQGAGPTSAGQSNVPGKAPEAKGAGPGWVTGGGEPGEKKPVEPTSKAPIQKAPGQGVAYPPRPQTKATVGMLAPSAGASGPKAPTASAPKAPGSSAPGAGAPPAAAAKALPSASTGSAAGKPAASTPSGTTGPTPTAPKAGATSTPPSITPTTTSGAGSTAGAATPGTGKAAAGSASTSSVPGESAAAPGPTKPVVTVVGGRPAGGSQAGPAQPAAAGTRPVSAAATSNRPGSRPWNAPARPGDDSVYVPLGQKSQIVVSMSYGWLAGITSGILVVMFIMLVIGWMTAGPKGQVKSELKPTKVAGGTTETGPEARANSVVTPPVIPAPPGGPVWRVLVKTVPDNEEGKNELVETGRFLKGQGYDERDFAFPTTPAVRGNQITLTVGKYGSWTEADREAAKIKKMRKDFNTAYAKKDSE